MIYLTSQLAQSEWSDKWYILIHFKPPRSREKIINYRIALNIMIFLIFKCDWPQNSVNKKDWNIKFIYRSTRSERVKTLISIGIFRSHVWVIRN